MKNSPVYRVGIINERPIRFYKHDDEILKNNPNKFPYFFDRYEVARFINRKTETLDSFIDIRNSKRGIVKCNEEYRKTSNNNFVGNSVSKESVKFKTVSFEEAALYWLEFAIMGNSLALQVSKNIIEKPLEKIASEVFWKKAITDKQLQIQEAVKIAKQEETIINRSILVNKKGEKVYTLDGTIEKARTIMKVDSNNDALTIIESGVRIMYVENPVVRINCKTITKKTHDEIIEIANRYRFIDSREVAAVY